MIGSGGAPKIVSTGKQLLILVKVGPHLHVLSLLLFLIIYRVIASTLYQ